MTTNTERNEVIATTTEKYFFASNFASIDDEPMYQELADMLEMVKQSNLHSSTYSGIHTEPGFIADDVIGVLMNKEFILTNNMIVKYYKAAGSLYLRIPYIANIVLDTIDGWSEKALADLARIPGHCIIGLVARAVNMPLVHAGNFYDYECSMEYPWWGKAQCDKKVSDFESTKYTMMEICRVDKANVEYEADGDGFIIEDRFASNLYLAEHNTITGGFIEDDIMISAYGTDIRYGRI